MECAVFRLIPIFSFGLMLVACNAPPPQFAGIPPETIVVAQSTFDVRIKDTRALALRTNQEVALSLGAVAPRAIVAIEQASGCTVVPGTVSGDQVFITADLSC